MSNPERDPAVTQLYPAYGLVIGAVIGLLLGVLDVVHIAWGLVGGAALGLIVGAAAFAIASRR